MALEDTRKVKTTTEEDYANALLSVGWKLLLVHSTTLENMAGQYEGEAFTLGWQSEDPPQLDDYAAWRHEYDNQRFDL